MGKFEHWSVKYRNQVADTKGVAREAAKENIKNSKKLSGFKSVLDSKIKKNADEPENRPSSDSSAGSNTASSTAAGVGGTLTSRLGMGGGVSNPQASETAQTQTTEQKLEGLKQTEFQKIATTQNPNINVGGEDRRDKVDE